MHLSAYASVEASSHEPRTSDTEGCTLPRPSQSGQGKGVMNAAVKASPGISLMSNRELLK